MEHAKHPPLSLVLRRFENEVVELLPANPPTAGESDPAAAACRIDVRAEVDTRVYHVVLPDYLMVRPVDWRRFSYDHEKVQELLSRCVRDNLPQVGFEPWSEAQKARVEATLRLALGDLSSLFDLESVDCEAREDNRLLATIEGAHKNGERRSYWVEVAQS
jgi:hypothetical protein